MAVHIWCLLVSVFLASVGAEIYDQGPQTFYESSSPSPQLEQSASKEFVLYLTPIQARTLASNGALVQPQLGPEPEDAQNEEPQVVEEQREPQYENNDSEENQKKDSDSELEEIFKLLNQRNINEEEQPDQEQPTEKPREFTFSKLQQEDKKYFVPSGTKILGPAKSYSYVRFLHPSVETETLKPKPYRAQPSYYFKKSQDSNEQQEEKRPEEAPKSENQEDRVATLLQYRKIAARIADHKDRLQKNELELQSKLRELQDAPRHNNQKYAIEIEKLRSNLEKQNALSKVEAIAKPAPVLTKEEISAKPTRPVEFVKHVKVPVSNPVIVHVPHPFEVKISQPYTVPVEIEQPEPVPYVKTEKAEVQRPVPVEVERRVPELSGGALAHNNVYVKVNKPYLVERIAPAETNRQIPVEAPIRKTEKLTVLRHIWEH